MSLLDSGITDCARQIPRAPSFRVVVRLATCFALCTLLSGLQPALAALPGADDIARAYLQRWQAESGAPGVSAAVSVGSEVVFSGGVGLSDLQAGTAQNGRSVHNIGSISKTQAVVAVLQLVEQGKVDLEAPIQTYAPWFPRKAQPITVRQILTHTSGIRHYKDGEFGPDDVFSFRHYEHFEESTRFWRDDPLVFEPGTRWMYSSFATNLIQAIVESASGQGFEAYLTEHVWRPAGMADTRFDIPARIVPRRGQGYERGRDGQLQNAKAEDVSYKYAGGGMISTDEDLCRFGIALNAGVLLKPATLSEAYRLQLPADIPYPQAEMEQYAAEHPGQSKPSRGLTQGLIFGVGRDAEGRRYAGHSGGVKGTESHFKNYYQDGVVVALHFNADAAMDVSKAAEALARLYLPAPKAEKPKAGRAAQ